MKKNLVRLVSLTIFIMAFCILISAEEPSSGVDSSEVEQIQEDIDTYVPIDDDGNFDPSGMKSKAELRVEKINSYVKPITKFLWGVEFTLSWIFLFSVVVWIILTELVVMPISEVLDFNVWGCFFAAFIIATLAMQGFGKDMAAWMASIATSWEAGAVTFGFAVVFAAGYAFVMKFFGKWIDKWKKQGKEEQLEQNRELIQVDADMSRNRLEDEAKAADMNGTKWDRGLS